MSVFVDDSAFAGAMAETVKAIGHPVRLRILALLCSGGRNVSDMARDLDIPQAIVSQQLRILRLSRLVVASREEGFAVYALAEPRLVQLVACLEGCTLHSRPARHPEESFPVI
jgi:ArsR family transcriptional regulator